MRSETGSTGAGATVGEMPLSLDLRPEPHLEADFTTLMAAYSEAYLAALSVQACSTFERTNYDRYSVDGTMRHRRVNIAVEVQLKSKIQERIIGDGPFVDLDIPAYNRFRVVDHVPRFLMLLRIPKEGPWLCVDNPSPRLRFELFWASLRGLPEKPQGQRTARIRFLRENLVTASWICRLFEDVSLGDLDRYRAHGS